MKRLLNLKPTLLLGLVLSLNGTQAAMLSTVPMQGGMVMPMIGYRAVDGGLYVMVNPTVPELTPLMISHPGDHFDPADPWYDCLDPERQGLAFSRRYGFVMDVATDPLPPGTAIWIRRIEASPELGFYQYRSGDPKAWEPIFGTGGSPSEMQWNGMMFHPGVTVPPGVEAYSANFEAYLADAVTGDELAETATGPFALSWTGLSDGRPLLRMSAKVVIAWPSEITGYVLEAAEALDSTEWNVVTNSPVVVDGESVVIMDRSSAQRYFRMRAQP